MPAQVRQHGRHVRDLLSFARALTNYEAAPNSSIVASRWRWSPMKSSTLAITEGCGRNRNRVATRRRQCARVHPVVAWPAPCTRCDSRAGRQQRGTANADRAGHRRILDAKKFPRIDHAPTHRLATAFAAEHAHNPRLCLVSTISLADAFCLCLCLARALIGRRSCTNCLTSRGVHS